MANIIIMSSIWQDEDGGKWFARWFVGTRTGFGEFDTRDEAMEFCKRNINRELGL